MGADEKIDLARFAENLPGAAYYFTVDAERNASIHFLNKGCEVIWGISSDVIKNDPTLLWQMIAEEDLPVIKDTARDSARTLTPWETQFRIVDGHGVAKTLVSRGTPERLPNGEIRWLTYLFDITDQVRAQKRFELVSDQLNYISSAIPDGFALFDADERLVVCNKPFREIYAIDPVQDVRGRTYKQILRVAASGGRVVAPCEDLSDWMESALENFRSAVHVREQPWGGGRWMRVLDRSTEDGGRVAFRIEITKAIHRRNELEQAAATDALTGVLNRRGLSLLLDEATVGLNTPFRLAILHIDLDKFKEINDTFGHDAGDQVLINLADRLRNRVPKNSHIARVGGDEFVIVFATDLSDCHLAKSTEDLRKAITEPISIDGRVFQVGASVGLATWAAEADITVEQSLTDADTALIIGKTQGRDQTVVFSSEMRQTAAINASVARRMRDGVERGAFFPFFQPVFKATDHKLAAVEVLARWKQDDGTIDPAASFLSIANTSGLLAAIEAQILTSGFAAMSRLAKGVRVSVNLSIVQLRDSSLVSRLREHLQQHGIAASDVTFDLGEASFLDTRTDTIATNINRLADEGFRIAVDDFGSGQAALTTLVRFPVHEVKIDRCLIADIDRDTKKRSIVGGFSQLCANLNIETVAEGVETAAELACLQELGLDYVQGYHLARPMPFDQLTGYLENQDKNGLLAKV